MLEKDYLHIAYHPSQNLTGNKKSDQSTQVALLVDSLLSDNRLDRGSCRYLFPVHHMDQRQFNQPSLDSLPPLSYQLLMEQCLRQPGLK